MQSGTICQRHGGMYCLHLHGRCFAERHTSLKRHDFVTQKAVDLDSLRVSENRVRISGSNSQERDGDEKILHRYYEYNGQIKEMGGKRKIVEQGASSKLIYLSEYIDEQISRLMVNLSSFSAAYDLHNTVSVNPASI